MSAQGPAPCASGQILSKHTIWCMYRYVAQVLTPKEADLSLVALNISSPRLLGISSPISLYQHQARGRSGGGSSGLPCVR